MKELFQSFWALKHAPIYNYVLPGMTSYLIADPTDQGCIRMFANSMTQYMHVTPHSHRFNFKSCVLHGSVINQMWESDYNGDQYVVANLLYNGKPGEYSLVPEAESRSYRVTSTTYNVGDWYEMEFNQVHSIIFSKDARVAIFEGPQQTNETKILLPYVNGEVINTFKVQDWMFKSG